MARTAPVHVGLTQVGRTRLGRLITLRLRSQAMGDVQPVRVLLPPGFDGSGRTRYPVLYLLHGAGGDYRSWIDQNAVQDQLGDLGVITVMASGSQGGTDGGYSDWFGLPAGAPGVAPAWESFHIHELLPFIDAHFPTVASAAGRAIAGLSMGGGGAAKYAGEYPGTFGYVGAFSAETNPLLPLAVAFQTKTCKWGDPALEQVRWRDNDATSLAGNLRGVRVFVRCGDGTPGPFDAPTPPADPGAATVRQAQLAIEYGAGAENRAFVAALAHAGVDSVDARFFHGSHSLPYWRRDTAAFLSWLAVQLRRPVSAPSRFRVMSAHAAFTAWGWRFVVHRSVEEFLYVSVRGRTVTVRGSGRVDVAAPPSAGGGRVALSLGPSHRRRQVRFDAAATRGWRSATATL